ncbi:MAG: hypothetical protein ACRDT6_06060 [Micromonosporaceae bacterium]
MTIVAVAKVVYRRPPTCRWCREPIRLVLSDNGGTWVHLTGGFPCRDPESGLWLTTQAAPGRAAAT